MDSLLDCCYGARRNLQSGEYPFSAWLWRKARTTVLVHKSPKLQMIDDPRVVIASLAVKAAVLVFFLANIFYNYGYWKIEAPYGSTNIWGQGYDGTKDARLCSRLGECDFIYDASWTYDDNRCKHFTKGEVMRKLPAGGFYIQTHVQEWVSTYSNCGEDALGCRNITRPQKNYFVPGVEDVEIFVEHGFTAVQRGVSKHLPKTTVWRESGAWIGKEDSEAEKSFGEGEVFKMKLKDLLHLAGIDSLDAKNDGGATVAESVGLPAYRLTGMTIELQIDYTNKVAWRWSGNKYVARASVAKAPVGWSGLGEQAHVMSFTPPSAGAADGSSTAYETYSGGIKIVVAATGEIGNFDFFYLAAVIAQSIVYMGISVVVAEFVAQSLLGDKSVDYSDDKKDFTHCNVRPQSFRGEHRLEVKKHVSSTTWWWRRRAKSVTPAAPPPEIPPSKSTKYKGEEGTPSAARSRAWAWAAAP